MQHTFVDAADIPSIENIPGVTKGNRYRTRPWAVGYRRFWRRRMGAVDAR